MKKSFVFFLLVIPFFTNSQVIIDQTIDSWYREDQIYFAITYNTFLNSPDELIQTNFSPGFRAGFIRDFPINSKRNRAIAIGLGYSLNIFVQNLKITDQFEDSFNYEILSNQDFEKNRFSFQALEIPLEFRWRTSNNKLYKFWRIYAGLKASYLLNSRAFFKSYNESISITNIDLKKWQYGLTMSAGYNNWNTFIYYGLNPIFDNANIGTSPLKIRILKVGLIFYVL